MKKNLMIVSFLLLLISLASPLVLADEDVTPTAGVTGGIRQRIKERITERQERRENIIDQLKDKIKAIGARIKGELTAIRQRIKERITERQERRENIIDQLKDKIKAIGARIKGELTAISGNTLTLKKEDDTSISVDVTNAQCRRRFGAKCEWSELAVGDILNVVGKWTDDTKTAITAKLVRNASIQKRFGVVFGKVTQINDGNLVIDSKKGDEVLSVIIYTAGAKLVQRNEQEMKISDIQIGHRIRAKGVWDRTLKEMRETAQVKDFDLPVKAKPTETISE